jgi:hypothetical protein
VTPLCLTDFSRYFIAGGNFTGNLFVTVRVAAKRVFETPNSFLVERAPLIWICLSAVGQRRFDELA